MNRLVPVLLFLGFAFLCLGFVFARAVPGMPITWVFFGLAVVALIAAVFKDIRFWKEILTQRATKQGMNVATLTLIVIGILGAVNYLAFRHNKKIDTTREKLYSLSPQSKDVARSFNDDLKVIAFFDESRPDIRQDKQKFKELVSLYESENPKLQVRWVDPVKRPDELQAYDVKTASAVVLEYKGKKGRIDEFTEQAFTNALLKLKREKNKVVYYLTGHGEVDFESSDVLGASSLKKYLTDAGYEVRKLNLLEKAEIPTDGEEIIIAGPKQAYLEKEVGAIRAYLKNGGRLFIALDPGVKSGLTGLLKEMGIDFRGNYILDLNGERIGVGPATAVGLNFSPTSDITKNFPGQGRTVAIFHIASQLKPLASKPEGVNVDEIVKSSEYSFTKPELKTGEVRFVEGKDEKGPLTIAATVNGKFKDGKEFDAVVYGDSDFMTNRMVDTLANRDLVMNSISFLAKDLDQVNIRPKSSNAAPVTITKVQGVFIWYGLLFALPLAVIMAGSVVYFRRRAA